MNVRSEDYESITLVPSNITVEQKFTTLFSITDFKLTNATDQSKGICMTITMKRKITSELVTTYFPSLLLMVISYATTFFKPFFFEAALSVNLTTMLVMTTIFISKMESLPPTSDIKMIDYWLILCQLGPFAQVVLLTAMEYVRDEDSMESKGDQAENDECPTVTPLNDNQDNCIDLETVGAEQKVQEACSIRQPKVSKARLLPKLVVIGKSKVPRLSSLTTFPYINM